MSKSIIGETIINLFILDFKISLEYLFNVF